MAGQVNGSSRRSRGLETVNESEWMKAGFASDDKPSRFGSDPRLSGGTY